MNKTEVISYLHTVFGGRDKHNGKVEEILEKSLLDQGLKKAYEYLEYGKRGQKNCRSDWAYWAYAGDICLAKVLIAILIYLKKGKSAFPDLPFIEDKVLMDKQAVLEEWAHNLLSNHKHEYVMVSLKHGEKNEDYPDGCPYAAIIYDKCKICGDQKYGWEPPKP